MEEEKKLDNIHHITICVSNLENSKNWYLSSFNCNLIAETTFSVIIEFANTILTLSLPSSELPHLAITHNSAEEYGILRQRDEGCLSTIVSDPSGNIVELIKKSLGINPTQADTR